MPPRGIGSLSVAKTKKSKLPKKPSRKSLVRQLDETVSLLVRKRDKVCVTCGSIKRLGCGHVFSRVAYSTRWDLTNCHCQCAICNLKHEYDPYPYMKFLTDILGVEGVEALHRQYVTPRKWKDYELTGLLEELKVQLESIR